MQGMQAAHIWKNKARYSKHQNKLKKFEKSSFAIILNFQNNKVTCDDISTFPDDDPKIS
jgi:hypothetical protein